MTTHIHENKTNEANQKNTEGGEKRVEEAFKKKGGGASFLANDTSP